MKRNHICDSTRVQCRLSETKYCSKLRIQNNLKLISSPLVNLCGRSGNRQTPDQLFRFPATQRYRGPVLSGGPDEGDGPNDLKSKAGSGPDGPIFTRDTFLRCLLQLERTVSPKSATRKPETPQISTLSCTKKPWSDLAINKFPSIKSLVTLKLGQSVLGQTMASPIKYGPEAATSICRKRPRRAKLSK